MQKPLLHTTAAATRRSSGDGPRSPGARPIPAMTTVVVITERSAPVLSWGPYRVWHAWQAETKSPRSGRLTPSPESGAGRGLSESLGREPEWTGSFLQPPPDQARLPHHGPGSPLGDPIRSRDGPTPLDRGPFQ